MTTERENAGPWFAIQWLLGNAAGVAAGLASSIGMVGCGMTFIRLTRGADVHVVWGGAAGGAVYGAVTGAVLHWLLLSYRRDDDAINVLPKKFATVL